MTTAMTQMESVLMRGDLASLNANERILYYGKVCESLGLNPLTRPFEYITLNGKLTLYAKRDATDQLRKLNHVSVTIISRASVSDLLIVTAQASLPDGRKDESIGAVFIGGLKGDALANAMMKAETKAKRRVTLSICGLGLLDETEAEPIGERHVERTQIAPPTPSPTRGGRQDGADRPESLVVEKPSAVGQTDAPDDTRGYGAPIISSIRKSDTDPKSDPRTALAVDKLKDKLIKDSGVFVTPADRKEIKSGPWERDRASDAQIKRLWAKGREYGIDDKTLHAIAGVEHFEELTKKSIQDVFLKVEAAAKNRQSEFNPPREMGGEDPPF